jgi:hypothetical protein
MNGPTYIFLGQPNLTPLSLEGSAARWPAAALCEEQLWRLAEAVLAMDGTVIFMPHSCLFCIESP